MLALAAAGCWGLSAVVAKDVFGDLSPLRLSQFRALVAGVLLMPLAWRIDPVGLHALRHYAGGIAALGASLAAVNATYYLAIERLPVGVAVTIQYVGPLLVLLVRRRTVTVALWLAGLTALSGSALTAGFGAGTIDAGGVVLAAASAVAFGAYLLIGEGLARTVGPVSSVAAGFLAASVIWAIVQPWGSFPFEAFGDRNVAARAVFVAVAGSAVPFLLMLQALRRISAAIGGVLASSEPAFGAAFAWLLLSETLTPAQIAGMVLTTAAVTTAQSLAARE